MYYLLLEYFDNSPMATAVYKQLLSYLKMYIQTQVVQRDEARRHTGNHVRHILEQLPSFQGLCK